MLNTNINAKNNNDKIVKTSIFYINDVHSRQDRMKKLVSASHDYDIFVKSKKEEIDSLKLCSGDVMIGANEAKANNSVDFLNILGMDATTLGNHELDKPTTDVAKSIKNLNSKIVTTNLEVPDDLKINKYISKSQIIEKNGNKYGILGIQPFDLENVVTKTDWLDGIRAKSKKETIKELNKETEKLKEQGVNKIILLSHSGNAAEREIAQKTRGIDVILGGHSHDLIKGVKEGENLFYNLDNEPVIITQAGKNGKYFGLLNLTFDKKGTIVEVQNNILPTEKYKENFFMTKVTDKNLGLPKKVGIIKEAPQKPASLLEENAYASFIADAMKEELDADIALLNGANIRGTLKLGNITDKEISSITPFENKMLKIELTEKEIVEAIKYSGKSFKCPDNKPGILQVSGLSYKMTDEGELKELYFINKNNQKRKIDVNNPSDKRKYTVAIDNYYGSGRENFSMLNKIDEALEKYDFDKDKLAIDYIKRKNVPVVIKTDGRININGNER